MEVKLRESFFTLSGNTAKLLQSAKESLYQIAVLKYMSIIASLFNAIAARWNYRYSNSGMGQCGRPIGVVPFISHNHARIEAFDQRRVQSAASAQALGYLLFAAGSMLVRAY